MLVIDSFTKSETGEDYSFLSNMYPCLVKYNGIVYTCSEAAYQAAKSLDPTVPIEFCSMSGPVSKRRGRQLKLREDWDDIKLTVMEEILRAKFSHKEMADLLLSTGDAFLLEGNTWHDNFWGNCRCDKCASINGQNHLGGLLMKIREELRNSDKQEGCTDGE